LKLLFDENLSHRLRDLLQTEFPGSEHVRNVGLVGTDDARIWEYARDHALTIVSKDNDFRQRSFLDGAPPKVIWLQVGNAGTTAIEGLLRQERPRVDAFALDPEASLLVLSLAEPGE
jgi:predicted nuclease of predicted toxin-antitoxin system